MEERQLRVQELAELDAATGRLVFRIQRRLAPPNETLNRHWNIKQRERKRWQASLVNAVVASCGLPLALELFGPGSGLPGARGACAVRRRVAVTRLVPSGRHFIRDDDNLAFAAKQLRDAIKQLGLIREDNRKWVETVPTEQGVSGDGTFWTVVVIEGVTS